MAAQEFNCPNCGAPLDYEGRDASTIRCPYCDTVVVVRTGCAQPGRYL